MILKGVNSKKVKPHFSAKKNNKHIVGCIYMNTYSDNIEYNLDNVNVYDFFNNVLKKTKVRIPKKENITDKFIQGGIGNIKNLYTLTCNSDYEQEINRVKIDDFLITEKNYQKHWSVLENKFRSNGVKLVELSYSTTYRNFKADEWTIYCLLPYDEDCKHKPKIKLRFIGSSNYNLYDKIDKKLDEYKKSNNLVTIVVLGEFTDLSCEITSHKQIEFIEHLK